MSLLLLADPDISQTTVVRYLPALVAGVSASVALILAGMGWRTFQRARASIGWPAADGKIIRSETVPGGRGAVPEIIYEYLVNGEKHTGDRINAGSKNYAANSNQARAKVEQYPMGTRVRVFYDPAAPAQSALEPGARLGSMILLIVGAFCLVMAVIEYFVVSMVLHANL